jgi:acyl carrier protein
MSDLNNINSIVKDYVMREFLPGEDPNELLDSTPLVSGGILDSLATVKLVAFLEDKYGVQFQPHEISADHLDTLPDIANTVTKKLAAKA